MASLLYYGTIMEYSNLVTKLIGRQTVTDIDSRFVWNGIRRSIRFVQADELRVVIECSVIAILYYFSM